MATVIVGIIVFGIIGLSLYFSIRKPKGGGCHGCSGCSSEKTSEKQSCSSNASSDHTS